MVKGWMAGQNQIRKMRKHYQTLMNGGITGQRLGKLISKIRKDFWGDSEVYEGRNGRIEERGCKDLGQKKRQGNVCYPFLPNHEEWREQVLRFIKGGVVGQRMKNVQVFKFRIQARKKNGMHVMFSRLTLKERRKEKGRVNTCYLSRSSAGNKKEGNACCLSLSHPERKEKRS